MRIYSKENVLIAAEKRISKIFDMYENITVSVSGGKDSSVLFHLAHKEAIKRNRLIYVAFIDQEAEYAATIEIIRYISQQKNVLMNWYQIPFLMTNSASMEQDFMECWNGQQIREYENNSIKSLKFETKHLTWEKLLPKIESIFTQKTAQLIGLRSSESLNRYRAVTKNPAIEGINWSSKTSNNLLTNFYPIYDWGFDDIWRYIFDEKIKYNVIYDYMFARCYNINDMRISCLIHEKAYQCLVDLPIFEPKTYEWLCKRIKGIPTAMRYAKEKVIYSNEKLPPHYNSWLQYRDFLLENHRNKEQKERYIKRFEKQPKTEDLYKQQVGQLLINDWEGITQITTDKEVKRQEKRQKYLDIL